MKQRNNIALSFGMLLISLVINYYAALYAAKEASNYVNDIILSNTRAFDVDGIFLYGPFLLWAFVAYLLLKDPKKIPFTIKSIALFVVIRSVFITLTHLGPFPNREILDSNIIAKFTLGADLFFSAHTGLPFLMAFVFGDSRKFFVLFTATAVLFGTVVLLAHLHYSIDVLSAFFITYAIYKIARKFFKNDHDYGFAIGEKIS